MRHPPGIAPVAQLCGAINGTTKRPAPPTVVDVELYEQYIIESRKMDQVRSHEESLQAQAIIAEMAPANGLSASGVKRVLCLGVFRGQSSQTSRFSATSQLQNKSGGLLLFDAQMELHNRFLHIDYPYGSQAAEIIAPLHRTKRKRSEKSGQKKAVRNASPKTVDRLWLLLKENPRLSQAEMVEVLGVTRSTIQKHLDNLKKAGRLRRIGPDKGGRWEVVSGL